MDTLVAAPVARGAWIRDGALDLKCMSGPRMESAFTLGRTGGPLNVPFS